MDFVDTWGKAMYTYQYIYQAVIQKYIYTFVQQVHAQDCYAQKIMRLQAKRSLYLPCYLRFVADENKEKMDTM